jgi:hypothetical protein
MALSQTLWNPFGPDGMAPFEKKRQAKNNLS